MLGKVDTYVRIEQRRQFDNNQIVDDLTEDPLDDSPHPIDCGGPTGATCAATTGWCRIYAASSRQLTLFTLIAGFTFLLAVGAATVLLPKSTALAITASVIAAAGGAVTAFIGNAVLRNSEASSREVLAFFSHPLEVERLLSAERIVDGMSDASKDTAKPIIVNALSRSASAAAASGEPDPANRDDGGA